METEISPLRIHEERVLRHRATVKTGLRLPGGEVVRIRPPPVTGYLPSPKKIAVAKGEEFLNRPLARRIGDLHNDEVVPKPVVLAPVTSGEKAFAVPCGVVEDAEAVAHVVERESVLAVYAEVTVVHILAGGLVAGGGGLAEETAGSVAGDVHPPDVPDHLGGFIAVAPY